jgi:hypothetical protein
MYRAALDAALVELRQDLERVADLGAEGRSFEELIGEVRSAIYRTGLEALRAAAEMLDARVPVVERGGIGETSCVFLAPSGSLEMVGGSNECGEERVARAESRRISTESSTSARSLRRGALATVNSEGSWEGQSRLGRWASRCDGERVGRQCEVGEDLVDDAGVGEEREESAFSAAVGTGRDGANKDAADAGSVPSAGVHDRVAAAA